MAVCVPKKPLFSFGVVADIQYADKDDTDIENRIQRYREAPKKLLEAVSMFNSINKDLLFVLTLGDIIDGNSTVEQTQADFKVVEEILSKLEVPAFHLLGNHCLSLPRDDMLKALAMPARYYQIELAAGWKLVVLDSMDVSFSWPQDTENYKAAVDYWESHPPGEANPQMAVWNGGIGSKQLSWLASLLKDAERDQAKLIIAAHHPFVEGSAPKTHLLWNHQEVASMLVESPAAVLYLCGHYHPGGYQLIDQTHFVTVAAILEAPTDSKAHGLIHVYDNEIVIEGFGAVASHNLKLP